MLSARGQHHTREKQQTTPRTGESTTRGLSQFSFGEVWTVSLGTATVVLSSILSRSLRPRIWDVNHVYDACDRFHPRQPYPASSRAGAVGSHVAGAQPVSECPASRFLAADTTAGDSGWPDRSSAVAAGSVPTLAPIVSWTIPRPKPSRRTLLEPRWLVRNSSQDTS